MDFKTKEMLKNEYWSKFLRTGKIEDYILFKRINDSDTEFSELGVNYDINSEEENKGDSNKNK